MSEDRDLLPDAPPMDHGESDGERTSAVHRPGDGRAFSVWAPLAGQSVHLELNGTCHAMQPAGQGWWSTEVSASPGDRYGYSIDDGPVMPSPRAVRLPDGPHGLSQVHDPEGFERTD